MDRSWLGKTGAAAAIALAVVLMFGLFVYADRSGSGEGMSEPLTEQKAP